MKKLFVLTLALTFVLSGCKKYPEGPSLSLKSKTERMSNIWKFSAASFDGVSILSFVENYTWTINKDNSFSFALPNVLPVTGTWEFTNDKEMVKFSNEVAFVTEFTILKLKEDQVKLRGTDEDGNVYAYTLIPK